MYIVTTGKEDVTGGVSSFRFFVICQVDYLPGSVFFGLKPFWYPFGICEGILPTNYNKSGLSPAYFLKKAIHCNVADFLF